MNFLTPNNTILIDKPYRLSSTSIVKTIKYKFNFNKVGHAGTLDPLATGLLIICTGDNTKLSSSFMNLDKEYICTMQLGATTPSYDAETEIIENINSSYVTTDLIEEIFKNYIGSQSQAPPIYSAIKINGKQLYKYARNGKDVQIISRNIVIYNLQLLKYISPIATFKVNCSKGTYIRSLVNDIGKSLKCGAFVKELRRTKIGNFKVENSIQFKTMFDNNLTEVAA
ncbi:MAG: tRNA pseudouridine(55) synthase TruB [Bacteroidetes bacterium]|nr:tRNA pseudouridine(55) synthase TruB [Bacteroidota bacterium]